MVSQLRAEQLVNDVHTLSGNEASIIYDDATYYYFCSTHFMGSDLTDAVWKISRMAKASPYRVQLCDGNTFYDNVATDLSTVAALTFE